MYILIEKTIALSVIFRESEEPVNENEKNLVDAEKQLGQEDAVEVNKENPVNETEEKEPENKVSILHPCPKDSQFHFQKQVC